MGTAPDNIVQPELLLIRWVESVSNPDFSGEDKNRAVQANGFSRGASRRSSPNETTLSAIPTEVIVPDFHPGIVEPHQ